ncbi:MAG: flagellar export protein FliJ [Clostridia bacterium]|nr:flagellar export protein FliJ [Clostridia bacterium]
MFKFRLANVLRLRKHHEKLSLEQVGKCLQQLQEAVQKKEELEAKIAKLESDFSAVLEGAISSEIVKLYNNYLVHQQEALELQEQLILEKKKNLEEAREKFIQAMKERKIMDKLKEKQYIRYQQEQGKKEQNFQDELAVTSKRR